jgi:hypothetical protein
LCTGLYCAEILQSSAKKEFFNKIGRKRQFRDPHLRAASSALLPFHMSNVNARFGSNPEARRYRYGRPIYNLEPTLPHASPAGRPVASRWRGKRVCFIER